MNNQLHQLPQFPSKKFYDFNSGVPVDNETINQWIKRCYENIQENDCASSSISSGNTRVEVERCEDGEYQVYVTQGYYKAFFTEE